jgi:ADP-ribosylation factor 2-binding protein
MASPRSPGSPAAGSADYAQKYEHKLDESGPGAFLDDSLDASMDASLDASMELGGDGSGVGGNGSAVHAGAAGGGAAEEEEEEEDEEMLFGGGAEDLGSPEDQRFDEIVGCLEEVLMDPEFQLSQDEFCLAHCDKFFNDDENRLEYTPLFEHYAALIENFIGEKLAERVDGFSMEEFQEMLEDRSDQICGDIFDLLLSLSDFGEFKDLMLSFKAQKAGGGADKSMMSGGFVGLAPVVTPFNQ